MYLKDLLRYRNAWLGFAMLWIVLYHLPFSFWGGAFALFKSLGYAGVDICMFASGIGCYYSLHSESDVGVFIKKRLNRIMPTYLVFMIFWLVYQWRLGAFNLPMAIGNIFAVQQLTGNAGSFNWYISAILLFYFFAPCFKTLVDRTSRLGNTLFLFFLILVTIPFWNSNNMIIIVTRLTIFYIGMLLAKLCKADVKISAKYIVLAVLMFLAGCVSIWYFWTFLGAFKWSHGLYWYPFILVTPPLCMAISLISMLLEKSKITKVISWLLSICGAYSFEIYLVHIPFLTLVPLLIKKYSLESKGYILWLASGVLLIVGCFVLKGIITLWGKRKKQS